MRAGTLNKLVWFQALTESADGKGGITKTYADSVDAWASIWPLRAKERQEAMKHEATVTHQIRTWYQSGIAADMRIRYGSRYFNIISMINPDEANRELHFLAEEVLS